MPDRLNEMFPQISASIRQIENSGSVLELLLSITDMFPAHLFSGFKDPAITWPVCRPVRPKTSAASVR
jgi:hypothetical protein